MEYEKDIRKHPQISELEYSRSLLSMCEAERRDIESRLLKADENKRIDKKLTESIVGVLGKTGYEKCEKLRKNLQSNIESIDTESLTEIEYKCEVRKIEKKFKNKYLNLACKYSFNSAKLSNIISHFDDTYATGSAAFPPVPVPVSSDKNCVGKVDTLLPPFSPGSMNFSDPFLPDNNGQAAYTNYIDNYTGEFGGYSDIETYHRHEIARSEVHLIAALRFYYKIPTTGQIKIRCQFEITRDKSDIDPRPAPRGWWWNKRNYEV